MTDFTSKHGHCKHCQHSTFLRLHIQLMQSGARHFVWICQSCKKQPGSIPYFISSDLVRAHLSDSQIESLPVIMPDLSNRCAVCGLRAAELHHWAPAAIFGNESSNWPKDYLCKEHHDLWHSKVTPQLVKKEYSQ